MSLDSTDKTDSVEPASAIGDKLHKLPKYSVRDSPLDLLLWGEVADAVLFRVCLLIDVFELDLLVKEVEDEEGRFTCLPVCFLFALSFTLIFDRTFVLETGALESVFFRLSWPD